MPSPLRVKPVLKITGLVYALLGLVLAGGGVWLVALGGSAFYLAAGLGILASGILLGAGRWPALWVYAVVLIATLIWAVSEVGFDWWPLAARGDIIFPLGIWLLMPWITRNLRHDVSPRALIITLPLWAGVVAGVAVLAAGLTSNYHDIDGSIAAAATVTEPQEAVTQPVEDWRDYGRTQFGQRYSPLTQITPGNVKSLKVAWTFRTGDQAGKNDPVETTFEVTPIKVRDTVYLCSQHQRLFAVDAKTGVLRWSYDPKLVDNPTFQHLTCRGVSYHETAAGDTNADGAPAPADCPRTIFLPVNDGRMIAVNADTGKVCESFGDHGTLDLLVGMGVKTAGFYEPTSPPVVSDKILVIAGSVIDNYSTHEPSGVIRGFDIHTGKLIWAWDAGAADENALPSADYTYTENSPNSWMTASYDAKLGLVYLPMGVQTPDIWGGNRGDLADRYSSALVALDINTGKRVWSYQTVHHDLWDMDLPSQPTLVDLSTSGGIVPAVLQPTKTGNLFVLDRRTGQLIVPAPELPVPQGAAPGDHVTPTQPFSELTFRPEAEADGSGHVGRDDLRSAILPDSVPSTALRGHIHAALIAGHAGISRKSRNVRMGRHRSRSGAADRDRQPDGGAVRLQAGAARSGQSRRAERRASFRQRNRRAADVWHPLWRRAASFALTCRSAVLAATLGLHGRDQPEDHEDCLDASERNDPRQRADADADQDGRADAGGPFDHGRGRRFPDVDARLFHPRL